MIELPWVYGSLIQPPVMDTWQPNWMATGEPRKHPAPEHGHRARATQRQYNRRHMAKKRAMEELNTAVAAANLLAKDGRKP